MGLNFEDNTSPIRVAVIGAGAMATEHIRVFQDIEDVRIIGIYSRTKTKAVALAQLYGIDNVCQTISELYDCTQADLVIIAVSDQTSRDVGLETMSYNWAVLMEKPPGITPHQTAELMNTALTNQRRVFVGLNRRFYSVTQQALADLDAIDGTRYIYVQDQQNMQAMREKGFPEEVVKNWMYKNSIHLIDYLRIFGRGHIVAIEPIIPWRGENTAVVLTKVEFSSGDIGIYECMWQGPGPWAVTINTSDRRWELRPLEQAYYQNQGERQLNVVPVAMWDQQFKAGFRLQAQQVIDALHGKLSIIPSLLDAYTTMQLVETIYAEPT